MMAVTKIPIQPDYPPYRNYDWLRKAGLEYIEGIAHQLWSEYNPTDPGITMLESLCYAITDLGMRMDMPIEDLLVSSTVEELYAQFHTALAILPTAPVTELDYRKLLVNIRGVKNAWLQPVTKPVFVDFKVNDQTERPKVSYQPFSDPKRTRSFDIRGCYDLLVEYEDDIYQLSEARRKKKIERVNDQIRKVFHRNRNLCEDLRDIHQVPKQEVVVCGEIELQPWAEAHQANALILQVIQDYLAPSVSFYSLEDLLAEGWTADEIFNGPVLLQDCWEHADLLRALIAASDLGTFISNHEEELRLLLGAKADLLDEPDQNLSEIRQGLLDELLFHGFIKEAELTKSGLRRDIRVSDIIDLLLELEEVKEVRDLFIGLCEEKEEEDGDCQCDEIKVSDNSWKICLSGDAQPTVCFQGSNFRFFKGFLPITIQKEKVRQLWQGLETEAQQARFSGTVKDLTLPIGKSRDSDRYTPFQNDLPETYGVGPQGVPPVVGENYEKRQAEALQLKGYLMFFEQILITYFKQLGKVPELLSVSPELKATYFTEVVTGARNYERVYARGQETEVQMALEDWLRQKDNVNERNHERLDHLIARFAERFSEYTFMLFDRFDQISSRVLQQHKADFLSDYPRLSSRRFCGYNYYESKQAFWNTDNVSGVQQRMARLGSLDTYRRLNLKGGVSYEFYQEQDDDDESEFRWRISDDQDKILLSSSTHYHRKDDAIDEMKKAFELAQKARNMKIKQAEDGSWYFNVADKTGEVVGRRIEFFSSENKAKAARKHVVNFLKGKSIELEGMYLIEHLLLRPDDPADDSDSTNHFFPICHDQEKEDCLPLDPYSFRVSVILPGWTRNFGNPSYRQFLEQLIRLEMPAHILPKICWVSQDDMSRFEEAYYTLLQQRADKPTEEPASMPDFITILDSMRTVYWSGTLHDCVDEGENEEDNPVILNRTFLGNLQNPNNDG